jgi:putative nucleotidyltransferase with HDIG domain
MYTKMIDIKDARPGMTLADHVYLTNNSGVKMLAARKGAEIDANLIRMLFNRNVLKVEIVTNQPTAESAAEPAVTEKTPAPAVVFSKEIPKPEVHVPVKAVVDVKLKEEAVDSVKQLFGSVAKEGIMNKTTAYQCVSNVESVVDDLLNVISDDSTGLVHINDLKEYDEYTYHHSLSVSVLSIATGKELGLDDNTLFRLGRCAMLHDIGKQLIPISVINKNGKLTDDEFTMVKNHTTLGAISLKKNGIGDIELWNGAMFHHEKINGTGYPKKLMGKDIPLFSKIISVADVYDAVTSYRSYRSPMLPSQAFDVIFKDVGTAFDYDIVKAFLAKIDLYPVNTIVSLSDGTIARVVQAEGASKLRPAVRPWGSNETIVLAAEKNKELNITKVLSPKDLPEGYLI